VDRRTVTQAVTETTTNTLTVDTGITYLLGAEQADGYRAVFFEGSGAGGMVTNDDERARVVLSHRLHQHDKWGFRIAQLMDDMNLGWDWGDGSTLVSTLAAYPTDDVMVHYVGRHEWTSLYGSTPPGGITLMHAVAVTDTEDGQQHVLHRNLSGGAALAMFALYVGRTSGQTSVLMSTRLTAVES
jgi:hypothetical protein